MFGGKGQWWDDWELCKSCNTLIHCGSVHVCDESVQIAQRVVEFRDEWEETRWLAFDLWAETPAGRFESWYVRRLR